MKKIPALVLFLFITSTLLHAQSTLKASDFFSDTSMINATLTLDIGKIMNHNTKAGYRTTATFQYNIHDSATNTDSIAVDIRGNFRRGYCYLPPLRLIFNYNKQASLYNLKTLKLVSDCKLNTVYDEYILKEYLIYKLYNLLTNKSFHVRLLNVHYLDSSRRRSSWTGHAFFIEDIKGVAKRNDCYEYKAAKLQTEQTDRDQMTMVAVFEYMIGNTDWAVSVNHNIRLLEPNSDSGAHPFVVPYDFDYSGLVNTDYAVPDEKLDIENVQQRLYRGFPRQLSELNAVLDVFKNKKDSMYNLINTFSLLSPKTKKDMIYYLDGFFKTINSPADVKETFINNARTE